MSSRQIALVTGANKGIGLETARQLAQKGMTVLLGARDSVRGESAAAALRKDGLDVRFLQLDVTDESSIRDAAARIESELGRLDVMVNNAGVSIGAVESTPSTAKMADIRATFDVNFFGMIAATQAMLPLLRKSAAGRIVNLTSILGSLGEHSDPNSPIHGKLYMAYNASKAAVNMFTVNLAHELRGTKIKVNAAHPGWVKTDLGGEAAPLEVGEGAFTGIYLATLPDNGPSGGFYHQTVHMRW